MLLIGCTKENEEGTISKDELVGSWVIKMIDGEEVYTNEYFVCKFNTDNSQEFLRLVNDESGSSELDYTNSATYTITDNKITLTSDILTLVMDVSISVGELLGETGNILTYTETINIQQDVDSCANRIFKGIRFTDDYSDEIIGMWEGTVIEGDTSEPFDNIRLNFKSNQIFEFYCQDDDGSWMLLEQANKYAILANILSTQWDETDQRTAAEHWEIVINGDDMTWRATREGIANIAGFDLVRVVE